MIYGPEYERRVLVSGKTCAITVYQKSKSVWIAIGTHNGERRETKGASLTGAARDWVRAVEYWYHQN
jgi:hypothetical protein